MHFDEYDYECSRIQGDDPFDSYPLVHAALGISSECHELVDSIIDASRVPSATISDECGDLIWYIAYGARSAGRSFAEVAWHLVPGCGTFHTLETRCDFPDFYHCAAGELFYASSVLSDHAKKAAFHGAELGADRVIQLLSSCLLPVVQIAKLADVPLSLVAHQNVCKLNMRWPNGFVAHTPKK